MAGSPRTAPVATAPATAVMSARAVTAMTPADVRQVGFGPAPLGQRGYNPEEVDAFLDLVAATLAHDGAGSLTVADIHRVRFNQARLGVRGYHPDEVDAFLGRVIIAFGGYRG